VPPPSSYEGASKGSVGIRAATQRIWKFFNHYASRPTDPDVTMSSIAVGHQGVGVVLRRELWNRQFRQMVRILWESMH
jgi:hypothetical protein